MMAKKRAKVEVLQEPTTPTWFECPRAERIDMCLRFLYYMDVLTDSQFRNARFRAFGNAKPAKKKRTTNK